ncbi:hypothetical protein NX862_05885 [Rhodobacter sp. KR11]|jgi:hypothetical protein|uniref:hypothetical protein n=1 Tax=Rhodobacter sp. KR11 TaxID=2974588 RepID=UPI0022227229|nr:hypothetical protein [Rhodobacter sp. KR11]MCW1918274.1 hypothetical protein [Rhodobacter sp. KR11]
MPRWWWTWLIRLCIGALGASVFLLVAVSSVLSYGLFWPVWLALANLWWLWLLGAPWVFLSRRGRPWAGAALTLGALGGLWLWTWAEVVAARRLVLPPPVEAGIAPLDIPHSVGIEVAERWEGECPSLCLQLLAGPDVAWLRGHQDGLIWRRAPDADCKALDPDRAEAPCILALRDDRRLPDLWLEEHALAPKALFAAQLVRGSIRSLDDRKGHRLQDQFYAHGEFLAPILRPDQPWGFAIADRLVFTGDDTPETLLSRAGIRLGPEPAVDASLVLSLREIFGGQAWPRGAYWMASRFVSHQETELWNMRHKPADWALLEWLDRTSAFSNLVAGMKRSHPQLFAP